MQSSPKIERRLNSSRLRLKKPGARQDAVGRMLECSCCECLGVGDECFQRNRGSASMRLIQNISVTKRRGLLRLPLAILVRLNLGDNSSTITTFLLLLDTHPNIPNHTRIADTIHRLRGTIPSAPSPTKHSPFATRLPHLDDLRTNLRTSKYSRKYSTVPTSVTLVARIGRSRPAKTVRWHTDSCKGL